MDILVARQPIFDRKEDIAAYELLYREESTAASRGDDGGEPDAATVDGAEQVVLYAAVGMGLEQLTAGRPAFVCATRGLLLARSFELLDPNHIVVQVRLEDARDPLLHSPLEDLYVAGYHLALDGFPEAAEGALLGMVEYVKVHMPQAPPAPLAPAAAALARRGIRLIAENVPNRTVRDACLAAGIELFQGYLFSRPETIRKRDLSIEHIRTFHLMKLVRDVNAGEQQIEAEFRADVSLTLKLLRIVNSAAVGGRGVRSIAHAIRLIGRDSLYRWLGLLLLSASVDRGVEREIMRTALARARWCELLADAGSRPLAPGSLYIIGLLSLMDTLLGTPMQDLVDAMDLAPEVSGALLGHRGPLGQVLALAEHYESGDWDQVIDLAGTLGIAEQEVGKLYLQAIHWARERSEDL